MASDGCNIQTTITSTICVSKSHNLNYKNQKAQIIFEAHHFKLYSRPTTVSYFFSYLNISEFP